jgi:hypothetical protein
MRPVFSALFAYFACFAVSSRCRPCAKTPVLTLSRADKNRQPRELCEKTTRQTTFESTGVCRHGTWGQHQRITSVRRELAPPKSGSAVKGIKVLKGYKRTTFSSGDRRLEKPTPSFYGCDLCPRPSSRILRIFAVFSRCHRWGVPAALGHNTFHLGLWVMAEVHQQSES